MSPRADHGCTNPWNSTGAPRRPTPDPCSAEPSSGRGSTGLVHLETSDTWNPRSPETRRRRRLSRMRRATLTGARVITEALQKGGFRYRAAMVTLTYAQDGAWQPRHISNLVKHYRQWLERRGHKLRSEYVAELTARGRVHYHLCLWLPVGLTPPKPDKQGWWPHGSTRVEWGRRPIGYMAKYVSKGESGTVYLDENFQPREFPKGCRIHGRSGLDVAQRRVVAWWCAPRYVREHFPEEGTWVVRAKGGGWVHRETGELLRVAWVLPGGWKHAVVSDDQGVSCA